MKEGIRLPLSEVSEGVWEAVTFTQMALADIPSPIVSRSDNTISAAPAANLHPVFLSRESSASVSSASLRLKVNILEPLHASQVLADEPRLESSPALEVCGFLQRHHCVPVKSGQLEGKQTMIHNIKAA